MGFSRRDLIKVAGATSVLGMFPGILRANTGALEKKDITIAVGGKALIYYLPLSIAEEQGYFKDEGLNVTIADFAGGSKSLQAVVGGSADICSGAYEHTINLQMRHQFYRSFVLQGRAPMISLAVSKKNIPNYRSPADLKGKKIGVTAPGSSTNMLLSFFLSKHGVSSSDIAVIGVGAGSSAVTAIRSGQVDAISNLDPVMSLLDYAGEIQTIVDTRTLNDTVDIFGGPMPAGCLYTSESFIEKHPNTIQALTNAIVRADKWIQSVSVDEIAKVVPEHYLLGNPDVYKFALKKSFEGISPDGLMDEAGPTTALTSLASYRPKIKADRIDIKRTWTNEFVKRAKV